MGGESNYFAFPWPLGSCRGLFLLEGTRWAPGLFLSEWPLLQRCFLETWFLNILSPGQCRLGDSWELCNGQHLWRWEGRYSGAESYWRLLGTRAEKDLVLCGHNDQKVSLFSDPLFNLSLKELIKFTLVYSSFVQCPVAASREVEVPPQGCGWFRVLAGVNRVIE